MAINPVSEAAESGRGARHDRPDPARAPAHAAEPDTAGRRRLMLMMSGATGLTLARGEFVLALTPLGVGLLSACVAYGRWHRPAAPRRA